MNKTVYLRDDEVPIWERARELANDKLSPIIVAALKRYIAENEGSGRGYERIVLKFSDSEDNFMPKIKAFNGRWIFDPNKPLHLLENEEGTERTSFLVAETAKGNVVIHSYKEDQDARWEYKFDVYPSLADAVYAQDGKVNYAARKALEKRGIPVEELDI